MQWFIDIIKELIHGQLGYFDRGDPADADFTLVDFTLDNTWHDLDLSAIVPADAQAVNLKLNVRSAAAQTRYAFRKKGNVFEWNTLVIWSQVANIRKGVISAVACDSNRIIQYKSIGGVTNVLIVVVSGWWLR